METAMDSGWIESGSAIEREFTFSSYLDGAKFAATVAEKAEEVAHHPDIVIGYKKVKIITTTHDRGDTVTQKDINLANEIDTLYQAG
ncbi:MAG TPA: 4a-hydroxytetrahydrobiopterin dehydratase [Nitrospirae bacterium]|nr:4a-hydroxytetrahydrobiopterin dehydratase [Nitrospirota bacterium]